MEWFSQVIQAWYVMGRLGAYNSSNLQVGFIQMFLFISFVGYLTCQLFRKHVMLSNLSAGQLNDGLWPFIWFWRSFLGNAIIFPWYQRCRVPRQLGQGLVSIGIIWQFGHLKKDVCKFWNSPHFFFPFQGGPWNLGLPWLGCITKLLNTVELRVRHLSLTM